MRNLARELCQASCITYLDSVELSERLFSRGIKQCLLVACSDMGASLPFVYGAPEVNLLVFQNIGHRTTEIGIHSFLSETASNLVVYGHSDCQFMRFLAHPHKQDEAGQLLVYKYFKTESESLIEQYNSLTGTDEHTKWKKLSQWWVMKELQSVLASPQILHRAETRELKLHGWVYDAQEKMLEIFDPEKMDFVQEQ